MFYDSVVLCIIKRTVSRPWTFCWTKWIFCYVLFVTFPWVINYSFTNYWLLGGTIAVT